MKAPSKIKTAYMQFAQALTEQRISANAGFYEWVAKPRLLRTFNDVFRPLAAPYMPAEDDPRKFFIDLSLFNIIDLIILATYVPVKFWGGMIRIGGSASVKDTKFKFYWDLLKNLKLIRMIYMYTWPGWSVDSHIRNFMDAVEMWTPDDLGDTIIWEDVETHADKDKRFVTNHARDVRVRLVSETGLLVGIYSAPWFTDKFMELQDWMEEIWWWIARWFYPDQQREHPGPVIMPFVSTGKVKQERCMFQQTGSRGDASAFGGTGAFDTDRFYLSDKKFKELFPGAGNGTLPGDCPDECKELIQAIMTTVDNMGHQITGIEQELELITPLLKEHGIMIDDHGSRISRIERILKAIAEIIVINKGA